MEYDAMMSYALTVEEEEQIRTYLPQFVFYRHHDGNYTDMFCTSCCDRFDRERNAEVKHNHKGFCPRCGSAVTFKHMDRGRRTYEFWGNFVICRAHDEDHLTLDCIVVRQSFEDEDSLYPDVDAVLKQSYELKPGEVSRYTRRWVCIGGWDWIRLKTINEPEFRHAAFGYADNSYEVIGRDEIDKTFLRYAIKDDIADDIPTFVLYLCKFAQHPNIEYLFRGGFADIGKKVVSGGYGIHINWKTNDLKKMLRFNRKELNAFRGCSAIDYVHYLTFRRHLEGLSTEQVLSYWSVYGHCVPDLNTATERVKLSWKSLMDYGRKQIDVQAGVRTFLHGYADYIRECVQLDYDLEDPTILYPRDFWAAHQRNSSAITVKTEITLEREFIKNTHKIKWLRYTDKQNDLTIVLPKSPDDIVREGRLQKHCVAGYIDRHARGVLYIVFLRKISRPDMPYYTMEISTEGEIVQCRGYANNVIRNGGTEKPKVIEDFEIAYQKYLDEIFNKRRKSA